MREVAILCLPLTFLMRGNPDELRTGHHSKQTHDPRAHEEGYDMPNRREAIQELREKANELQQLHENVDNLLGELARNMQRLSEDWKNPAVAEIQSIVAGVIRHTRNLNETLGALARKFHAGADEAEEDERRKANGDDSPQGSSR